MRHLSAKSIAFVLFIFIFSIHTVYARSEDPVSRKVGVAGGTLISGNRQLTITVPAGAMMKEETVSVDRIASKAPQANGDAWHIQTTSATKKPLSVCWKLNKEQFKSAKSKLLGIAFNEGRNWYGSRKFHLNEADSTICFELKDGKSMSVTIGIISQYEIIPETGSAQPILVNQPVFLTVFGMKLSNDWTVISSGTIKEEIEELYVNDDKSGEGDMKDGSISESNYSSPYSALYVAADHLPAVNPVIVKATIRNGTGQLVTVETSLTIVQSVTMSSTSGGLINPLSVFTAMQGGLLTVSVMSDLETNDGIAVITTITNFNTGQLAYNAGPGIVFSLSSNNRVYSSDYYERENGITVKRYSNASLLITSITPLANHPGNAVLEGKLMGDLYHSNGSSNEKASVTASFRIIGTLL